jgi:hypothetical protein
VVPKGLAKVDVGDSSLMTEGRAVGLLKGDGNKLGKLSNGR